MLRWPMGLVFEVTGMFEQSVLILLSALFVLLTPSHHVVGEPDSTRSDSGRVSRPSAQTSA